MNITDFDYTEEDLRANRQGIVTPRQQEWVKSWANGIKQSQRGSFPIVIVFLILGLGLILGMNFSNERARAALLADPINLIVLCAVVPVVLGIVGIGVYFGNRRAAKLAQAELKVAEGIIRLDEEHSRVGTTYFVYVGKTEFRFGGDVSRSFPEGGKCRVYYCETSMLKMILSYELLN